MQQLVAYREMLQGTNTTVKYIYYSGKRNETRCQEHLEKQLQ